MPTIIFTNVLSGIRSPINGIKALRTAIIVANIFCPTVAFFVIPNIDSAFPQALIPLPTTYIAFNAGARSIAAFTSLPIAFPPLLACFVTKGTIFSSKSSIQVEAFVTNLLFFIPGIFCNISGTFSKAFLIPIITLSTIPRAAAPVFVDDTFDATLLATDFILSAAYKPLIYPVSAISTALAPNFLAPFHAALPALAHCFPAFLNVVPTTPFVPLAIVFLIS